MDEKKIKELSEKIYSVCLLIATQGQTKEMIKNDIEMGLKYFKAITINVFIAIYLYYLFEKYLFRSFIFLIFMILLGIVNGFYSVYKLIFPKNKK